MPSTFLRLAVDLDGSGRDIVEFGRRRARLDRQLSRQSGWRTGEPWGFEVKLPEGYSGPSGRKAKQPMSAWAARGVTRVDGRALGDGRGGPAAARRRRRSGVPGHAQFRCDLQLQRRRILLARIAILAQRLAGGPGIVTPWPTDDPGLSRAERRELQTLLTKRGYDVGEPDGAIGAKTKAAIADFEGKNGLQADGRASLKVLEALRR